MFTDEFGIEFINQNPKLKDAMEKKCLEAIESIDIDKVAEIIWQQLEESDWDWLFEDIDASKTLSTCLNEAIKKIFKGGK